jgi:hypothetical protein
VTAVGPERGEDPFITLLAKEKRVVDNGDSSDKEHGSKPDHNTLPFKKEREFPGELGKHRGNPAKWLPPSPRKVFATG